MEIINALIENTDSPEIQSILAGLKIDEDILFTNVREDGVVEVEYIKPINDVTTIGTLPADIITGIQEKYGDNVSYDILSYVVTYDQGVYSLIADISVDEIIETPPKEKRLPLPILIIVGVLTAILTIILVIVRLIFRRNKD